VAEQPAADAPSPAIVWVVRPNGQDVAAVYPRSALSRNLGGVVQLNCIIQADGAFACVVGNETPKGYGFGDAARLMAGRYRVSPKFADGREVTGTYYQLRVVFALG